MIETFISEHVLSMAHWPFLVMSLIFMMVGQVTKTTLFTKTRAAGRGKAAKVWWWLRKTMPLHPMAMGLVLGWFWVNPEGADPAWNAVGSGMYFAGAGVVSSWLYAILKSLAKKHDIDLQLPGQSDRPSAASVSVPPPTPPAKK